jgi:RimJ/RimL family protein N-acetyltransferase
MSEEEEKNSAQQSSAVPKPEFRYTEPGDGKFLKQWLLDPAVLRWFPMVDEVEIDDAVGRWIGFSLYKCSITAVVDNVPCGIATLYLQPYKKLIHQCEFGIIVGTGYRGKGIGALLIHHLSHLAKERFKIELLHLQVYADNPAMRLYSRLGFTEFGRQTHWIKEPDGRYLGRVFMEKFLT